MARFEGFVKTFVPFPQPLPFSPETVRWAFHDRNKLTQWQSCCFCNSRSHIIFIINLKSGREHVIAVRLASQQHIIYVSPLYLPISVFAMYLNGSQHAYENYNNARSIINKNTITVSILAGIFLSSAFITSFFSSVFSSFV